MLELEVSRVDFNDLAHLREARQVFELVLVISRLYAANVLRTAYPSDLHGLAANRPWHRSGLAHGIVKVPSVYAALCESARVCGEDRLHS